MFSHFSKLGLFLVSCLVFGQFQSGCLYFWLFLKKIMKTCKYIHWNSSPSYTILHPLIQLISIRKLRKKLYRSSHKRCSIKKGVLKNFAILTGKHLCWSLFLIKLQAWRSATLLKRDSSTGIFLWILWYFKNTCFKEHSRTAISEFKYRRGIARTPTNI